MANRKGTDVVAHASQTPGTHPSPLVFGPALALYTSLRPMPQGMAFKTFPKRHSDDLLTRFGEAVRTVRLLRAFSQEDLAARSGLHRTHISLVESATREPRLTTICTLAAALHVNPGDLLPVLFLPDTTPSISVLEAPTASPHMHLR